ncbi:cyclin-dependent kinase inhibitor 4-like [Olea europaea var. sylvestris]|uniref:cyclin-dependent kinase inhibitor 4-like n=1 Tax=Olea europaea var. sylvestris TaxID=158386 RepID=UPI000C1D2FA0|nr:cyclin-dependent kinase inhibitor 4-like [Olea europaea var. sylvestris]
MKEVSPSSLGVRRTATTTTPPASNSRDSCENEFSVADLQPGSVWFTMKDEECMEVECEELVTEGMEIDGSCGEINLNLEGRESRSTRKTKALSLIVALAHDTGATPGTTRQTGPTAAGQCESDALHSDVPSESEIDEFFDSVEQLQQCSFIEKYNFDFVKELPLPGRYEWVKLNPGAE